MQIAVNQLRVSPSLGMHSSGLFGDVKPGNFGCLPQKEALRNAGAVNVRACVGPPPNAPLSNSGATSLDADKDLPTRPTAPTATSDKNFTRPPPFSGFSGSLGLNFPGSQIPGLPGSPRPKPGTPRPYDPTKQKSKVMEWLTPPKPPTELLQREHFKLSDTCACTIYFGDLSKWFVDGKSDAVIAPSNKKLNTGPAVNAVLFKAAGSKLLECTQRLPDVAPQGIKAEMGDAISTRAFDLPVHRIIHTVGAVYKKNEKTGVRDSDPILEKAYKTALMVARYEQLKYLAFPPLSCNIYGYPYADGAEVALRTLKANCDGFERIDIVIRNIEGYEAFIDEANKVLQVVKEKKTIKVPAMAPRTGDNLPPAAAVATSIDPAQGPSATAGITEADTRPQALFSTAEPLSPAAPTYSQAQAPSHPQVPSSVQSNGQTSEPSAAQAPPAKAGHAEADSTSEASNGTAQSQSPVTPTYPQDQAPSYSQAPYAQGPSGYSSGQYQNAPAQYPNAPPAGQYQSPYQNAPSYQQQQQQRYNHNAPPQYPPQYQRQPPQYNQQFQNPQYRSDPSQQYGNPPYEQQQYGNIPPQQQYGNFPRYQQQQQQHGNYPPQQQYGNIPPQQQYGNPPAQQQQHHQYGNGNSPGESPTSAQVPPQHQHQYGRPPSPPQYVNFPPQQAPPPPQQHQQQQAYGNPSSQYTPPPRPDNRQQPF